MLWQGSHQKANTISWFQILWSTSMKADKSLHYFTEVLPFSAWPDHLVLLYITLFFIHIPSLCYKGITWKDHWKFNSSTFSFGSYSVKKRGGRDSRENDEHKQELSVRPCLLRTPFTAWGRGSTEEDGARSCNYNISICISTTRIN